MARTKQTSPRKFHPKDRRVPSLPARTDSSLEFADPEMEAEEEDQQHGSSPTKKSGTKAKTEGLTKAERRAKFEEDYSKQLDVLQKDVDRIMVDDEMEAAQLRANQLARLSELLRRKTDIEKQIFNCMHNVQADYDASVKMLNYLTNKRGRDLAAVEVDRKDEEETSSEEEDGDAEKNSEVEDGQGKGNEEDQGKRDKTGQHSLWNVDPKLRGGDATVAAERKQKAKQARNEDLAAQVDTAVRMAADRGRNLSDFGSTAVKVPGGTLAVGRVAGGAGRNKVSVDIPFPNPLADHHQDAGQHNVKHKRKHRHDSGQDERERLPQEKENRAWRASQARSVDTDQLRANQMRRDKEDQEGLERKRAELRETLVWGSPGGLVRDLGADMAAGMYDDTGMAEDENEVDETPVERKKDRLKKRKHVKWEGENCR